MTSKFESKPQSNTDPKLEENDEELHHVQPKTTYLESLVHLFKAHVGAGLFAMGSAFKHAGYVLAPILTVLIALVCLHCEHLLLRSSDLICAFLKEETRKDYADTVEACFANGPIKTRSWSRCMKVACNIFLCVTQLGFCSVYMVFVATTLRQILYFHGYDVPVWLIMLIQCIPIMLLTFITKLKWMWWVSLVASVCMLLGLILTIFFILQDGIPSVKHHRKFGSGLDLAVYFGTALFAFEGIACVLPLKNVMRVPRHFDMILGVLNIGLFCSTLLYCVAGELGYLKWGEDVGSSLTLNVSKSVLGQTVKLLVAGGVLLGYPIVFYVAIQILVRRMLRCIHMTKRPHCGELLIRVFFVLLTLALAEGIPRLGLFMSLIGSFCSSTLALIFPPLLELLVMTQPEIITHKRWEKVFIVIKDSLILLVGILGFCFGSFISLKEIVEHIGQPEPDVIVEEILD